MPTRPLSCAQNIGADKSRRHRFNCKFQLLEKQRRMSNKLAGFVFSATAQHQKRHRLHACKLFKTTFKANSSGPASKPAGNETITSALRDMMPNNSPVNLSISIYNIRYNVISK